MHITLAIDDELLATAEQYTGIQDCSALVHAALTALVQREAARRLARRGGSDPEAKVPRRRRPR